MRAQWIHIAIVGACSASVCSAQSPAYRFTLQASPGDWYGWCVASAGDTDGDGQPDILVGAPFDDTAASNGGAVYLYSGRTGQPLHSWLGSTSNSLFGWSVDGVEDLDGDGRSDVLIGAPLEDLVGADRGMIYVYSGAGGGLLATAFGQQAGCQFGSAVRGLGDVDGDGRGDFAVGAPYYDFGLSMVSAGRVVAFSGNAQPTLLRNFDGLHGGDLFGSAIEPVLATGDLLSSRIAIGAPVGGSSDQGQVRVYDFMGNVRSTVTGTQTDGWFGSAIACIGDLDGDGATELAIGEPYCDVNGTDSGRVTLCTQSGVVKRIFPGISAGEHFGAAVSGLGDFDGIGGLEFVASAPLADVAGMTAAGRVTVYSCITGTLLASWPGEANDSLGRGLARADLNLDGTPDVLIGGPNGTFGNGEVQVYLSCAPLAASYCVAKTNSQGCAPFIGFSGVASLSVADNFHVYANLVLNNKPGLAIWSTHGSASTPFNGATLCVHSPVIRTPGQSSGGSAAGNDCTGRYNFHFTQAYLLSKGVTVGDTLHAQVWSRDPGFAAPQNFGLTDGLRFVVVP